MPIDVNRPGENEAPGISNRLVPILLALIAASLAPSSRADKPPPPSTGAADDFPAPPGTSPAPPPSSPSRPDPEPDFVIAARAAAAASAKVIAPPERVMTTADIVDESERSVALIKGKSSSGTGFLVAPGLLVTNAHVIANERISDLEVRFPSADGPNKGPSAVELMDEDRSRDLAILAIRSKLPPLRVAPAYRYRKGEDVTVIGNPGLGVIGNPGLGDGESVLENAINRGVMSTTATIAGRKFYQLGIAVNPGNSGGPVFDSKGQVIGVVTLRIPGKESLSFCIPVEDLRAAIARVGAQTPGDATAARSRHSRADGFPSAPGASPGP